MHNATAKTIETPIVFTTYLLEVMGILPVQCGLLMGSLLTEAYSCSVFRQYDNTAHLCRTSPLAAICYTSCMKVTKIAHACMVVEEAGLTILIDPGMFSPAPELEKLDVILITHDHMDHYSPEVLKTLLAKHPHAEVITNAGVGEKLQEAGISFTSIADGERIERGGVSIESHGTQHALIHADLPMHSQNTGFMIADRLFYPGDALYVPPKPVEILALPVAGPWTKPAESIDYAKAVHPKIVIPVHDAMLTPEAQGFNYSAPKTVLEPLGIEFRAMDNGSVEEF